MVGQLSHVPRGARGGLDVVHLAQTLDYGLGGGGGAPKGPPVAVFGLGYVGTVSAACLASRGYTVIGVDVSHDKVAMVAEGRAPVVEERIGELIAEQVRTGRLTATGDAAAAVAAIDLALWCASALRRGRAGAC
jgi:GDP-mannose 6-dehydrogenase